MPELLIGDVPAYPLPTVNAVVFDGQAQLAELEEWTGGRCELAHDLTFTTPDGDEWRAAVGDAICRHPGTGRFFVVPGVVWQALTR